MDFKGTFEHSLDSKHRLTVPSRFRAAFAEGAVLSASPEIKADDPRCVSIYTVASHQQFIEDTIAGMRQAGPRARELKRFYLANAYDAELDGAYRLMIPSALREYAGLDTKVTITGVGDCLEVWNPDEYMKYTAGSFARISQLAASLDDTP